MRRLWKQVVPILTALIALCGLPLTAQTTDLLFTEYVEGSGNNKAIEIYNGTGATVDLTGYEVRLYSNGAATPNTTLDLTTVNATLADGATLVIANASAEQALLDLSDATSGVCNFNGNDALELYNGTATIDVIGVIGSDPGSSWGGGSITTQNDTIRRISTVCTGDVDGFGNPGDISDEWEGFAQNDFSGLGTHVAVCGGNAPVIVTCGGPLEVEEGSQGMITVSAEDADGTIVDIEVTMVTPDPAPGTIIANTTRVVRGGGAFTAEIVVSDTVPAGSYTVQITATNNDGTPQTGTCNLIVNVNAPPTGWIINEFLADPATDLTGDANGDGVRDSFDDEFVEIVNNTGAAVDITGWTLSDNSQVRHVFPADTVVENGLAVVVFGGGAPTGTFGDAIVQTASSGQVGLNNGGDTITLASTTRGGTTQIEVSYGGEAGNNQSRTLDPDITGTDYVDHSTATGAGGALFSPGTQIDGSPFVASSTNDLFFSEYIEGSSNNKALEIYNPTDGDADLSLYTVELYSNGSGTPGNTLVLSDAFPTLASGEVLVIANASADQAILDESDITSSVTFFNGNDAVALVKEGTVIDVIGVIGSNPGSEWGTGDISTGENTIRRLASVCSGDADGFDNPSDISDQWEGFAQNTFDGLGSHTANCSSGAEDLFFSEYIEGSSNNKALEIYNGTGSDADLSLYTVELYSNGSGTPGNTLVLSDAFPTLSDGEVLVIGNASADQAILDESDITSNVTFFNGNDAVALLKEGTIIDVIGVIGSNPGSEWGTGDISTGENTIRRLASVCAGDADGFDNPSDISDQWEGFPQNTFDGLGSHTALCGGGNLPVTVNCNSPAALPAGEAGTLEVTAADPDGIIVDVTVSNITPMPAVGTITVTDIQPATGATVTATVTVSADVPAGDYTVQITATNMDGVPQSANCDLELTLTAPLAIHEIQGSGLVSPVVDQFAITNGNVVTGTTDSGFFIQTPDADVDADPETSEGIFVFTDGAPGVSVGDIVDVSGNVIEFFDYTEFSGNVSVDVVSSGNPLPAAITFDASTPSPNPEPVNGVERFEGMLVSVTDWTVTGPTTRFDDFFIRAEGRAFREPGITYPGQAGLPVFDDNPEVLGVLPEDGGFPVPDLVVGDTVTATGPLAFSFGVYKIIPNSLSTSADTRNERGGPITLRPVRQRQPGEFIVASQNLFNLDADDSDYADRLTKFSDLIRNVLRAPDILGVQELESQTELDGLAAQILADDPSLVYTVQFLPANFGSAIGFLVRDTVTINSLAQFQESETFDFDGNTFNLHDRPPLVLNATYNDAVNPFTIEVVLLHLRSLIDNETDEFVQTKRNLQATRVSDELQAMQTADPDANILVIGDLNAYEFTDGIVDVLGQLTGSPDPLGALIPATDVVNPDFTNLVRGLPPEERYSFIRNGDAGALDHALASEAIVCSVQDFQFGRVNADFYDSALADPGTPLRSADHDPLAVFIKAPGIDVSETSLTTSETGTTATFQVSLRTAPESDVTIAVSVDDATEGSVDTTSLVFTPTNLGPQTVTVTGLDDALVDGPITYNVVLAAATSGDGCYDGMDPADVQVTNQDDDSAGIIVNAPVGGLSTSENGGSDTFTVELTAAPIADVTITLTTDDGDEIGLSADPVFTPANFANPQTVTVTGLADGLIDGDQPFTVEIGVSTTDPNYAGADPADLEGVNADADSSPDFNLLLEPGQPIQVMGTPGHTVGIYVWDAATGSWIFLENVTLDSNGMATATTIVAPDTTYGVGGADGSPAPTLALASVPTLGTWGLLIMIVGLMTAALISRRRRLA